MYNDNGTLNYLINGISIPYPVDQAILLIRSTLPVVRQLHGEERFVDERQ